MPKSARHPGRDSISVLVVHHRSTYIWVLESGLWRSPRIRFVGQAVTGEDGLELSRRLEPDVVLVDMNVPDMDGLELTESLRSSGSSAKVLVLTDREDPRLMVASARAGVDALMHPGTMPEQIAASIEAVADGISPISDRHRDAAFAGRVGMARAARATSQAASSLTPRQREVLGLVTTGLTSKQIATRMQLSERTVEDHLGRLYDKLGANTRTQALRSAALLGLVDIG